VPENVDLIQQHTQVVRAFSTPAADLIQQHVQVVRAFSTPDAQIIQQHVQVVMSSVGVPTASGRHRMFLAV
jgi:hypothetical protein